MGIAVVASSVRPSDAAGRFNDRKVVVLRPFERHALRRRGPRPFFTRQCHRVRAADLRSIAAGPAIFNGSIRRRTCATF
jgi:hypothetical protein